MDEVTHRDPALVGAILKQARTSAGLSLRELARRARTSHTTLHAYEQATKAPSTTIFLRILAAAGFAVDFKLSRRVREADGIERGKELEQVLKLASHFPANLSRRLESPRLAALIKRDAHDQNHRAA